VIVSARTRAVRAEQQVFHEEPVAGNQLLDLLAGQDGRLSWGDRFH
jgi:hypothetical protein